MSDSPNEKQFLLRRRRTNGKIGQVGSVLLTPQSEAVELITPWGGFVWNRPVSIVVAEGNQEHLKPIIDVTLWLSLVLAGITVLSTVIGWALHKRGR